MAQGQYREPRGVITFSCIDYYVSSRERETIGNTYMHTCVSTIL